MLGSKLTKWLFPVADDNTKAVPMTPYYHPLVLEAQSVSPDASTPPVLWDGPKNRAYPVPLTTPVFVLDKTKLDGKLA